MARTRKSQPTLDSIFFSTPEQKVIRYLLGHPTTKFSLRALTSKLKGVRGLGGVEGLTALLEVFEELGMVEFLDNRKAVRLCEEGPAIRLLKQFVSVCDLETLRNQLAPVSNRVILYGSRAIGESVSDSSYEICVVSESPDEVTRVSKHHPLGRQIELKTCSPDDFKDLSDQMTRGIVLLGSTW